MTTKERMSYIRMGVRLGRFQAHGGRFGPGKVHLYVWRKDAKQWVLECKADDVGAFSGYYGEQVTVDHPVTCKKCIKSVKNLTVMLEPRISRSPSS